MRNKDRVKAVPDTSLISESLPSTFSLTWSHIVSTGDVGGSQVLHVLMEESGTITELRQGHGSVSISYEVTISHQLQRK